MTNLYKKSEIWFAVVTIVVYVAGGSLADRLSETVGMAKSVSLVFYGILSALLFFWIKQNGLSRKFGLCKTDVSAAKYLYYIPLILLSSVNLWFGVRMNLPTAETLLYVGSMFFVGFLEEVIFRGFLFCAMAKDGVRSAVAVSSITFGIGHMVNLFNGSGAGIVENLCQIAYAVAFGFMFVLIFHRGGSLVPCIISHSTVNMLSVFVNDGAVTDTVNILLSLCLCTIIAAYCAVLHRTLPSATE